MPCPIHSRSQYATRLRVEAPRLPPATLVDESSESYDRKSRVFDFKPGTLLELVGGEQVWGSIESDFRHCTEREESESDFELSHRYLAHSFVI